METNREKLDSLIPLYSKICDACHKGCEFSSAVIPIREESVGVRTDTTGPSTYVFPARKISDPDPHRSPISASL